MAEETVDLPLGTAIIVLPWPIIRKSNGKVPKETYIVSHSEWTQCKELAPISLDALNQLRPDLYEPLISELQGLWKFEFAPNYRPERTGLIFFEKPKVI